MTAILKLWCVLVRCWTHVNKLGNYGTQLTHVCLHKNIGCLKDTKNSSFVYIRIEAMNTVSYQFGEASSVFPQIWAALPPKVLKWCSFHCLHWSLKKHIPDNVECTTLHTIRCVQWKDILVLGIWIPNSPVKFVPKETKHYSHNQHKYQTFYITVIFHSATSITLFMASTDNTRWSNEIDIGWRAADHTCELIPNYQMLMIKYN